jgi:hypothetical protein
LFLSEIQTIMSYKIYEEELRFWIAEFLLNKREQMSEIDVDAVLRNIVYAPQLAVADDKLARYMVAMANSNGGVVVVGCKRSQYNYISFEQQNRDFEVGQILEKIKEAHLQFVEYELYPNLEFQEYRISLILIKPAEVTAYYCVAKDKPQLTAYARDNTSLESAGKFYITANDESLDKESRKLYYRKVYKYMSLDALILSLTYQTWKFWEPFKWDDKFESRFYCADYRIPSAGPMTTPDLFATCVTRKQNCEASWKVYVHGAGLAARCAQLELDTGKLRYQLWSNNADFLILDKNVLYRNTSYITNLHDKALMPSEYPKYFSPITLRRYLNLLSLKREAFEYEQEVRIFAIPNKRDNKRYKEARGADLKLDWSQVINKVRIDENCSAAELLSLHNACLKAGIWADFQNFQTQTLAAVRAAQSGAPQAGLRRILFEAFNINAMPGNSHIIIK